MPVALRFSDRYPFGKRTSVAPSLSCSGLSWRSRDVGLRKVFGFVVLDSRFPHINESRIAKCVRCSPQDEGEVI